MFGCISAPGAPPVYKVIKLVVDENSSISDDTLKPLIPHGTFVDESYNPQFLTTSFPNNIDKINNKTEEDDFNEKYKDIMSTSQRITISEN